MLTTPGRHQLVYFDIVKGESKTLCTFQERGLVGGDLTVGAIDGQRSRYCVATNRMLVSIDLTTYETVSGQLACQDPISCLWFGDKFVVASCNSDDYKVAPDKYAIQVFDAGLTELWRHEGTVSLQMLVNEEAVLSQEGSPHEITSVIQGSPMVVGTIEGSRYIVATAGRDVLALDASTGAVVWQRSLSSSIVGARIVRFEGEAFDRVALATCDGSLVVKGPFGAYSDDPEGDSARFQLNGDIRKADFVQLDDGTLLAVAVPATSADRIVAYRQMPYTAASSQASDHEYSLDELITMAHSLLREGGRE